MISSFLQVTEIHLGEYLNMDNVSPGTLNCVPQKGRNQKTQDKTWKYTGINFSRENMELDTNGYDKYDIILQNQNLSVQNVLEELKELLDVKTE